MHAKGFLISFLESVDLATVSSALFDKKPEPFLRHPFAPKGGKQGWNEVGWGRNRGRGRNQRGRDNTPDTRHDPGKYQLSCEK